MSRPRTIKLLLLVGLGIGTLLLTLLLNRGYLFRGRVTDDSGRLAIQSLGRPWVQALTLSDVNELEPFSARVLSKRIDEKGVIVYLRRREGTELAVCEGNTNTHSASVLKALLDGVDYRFPLETRDKTNKEPRPGP